MAQRAEVTANEDEGIVSFHMYILGVICSKKGGNTTGTTNERKLSQFGSFTHFQIYYAHIIPLWCNKKCDKNIFGILNLRTDDGINFAVLHLGDMATVSEDSLSCGNGLLVFFPYSSWNREDLGKRASTTTGRLFHSLIS